MQEQLTAFLTDYMVKSVWPAVIVALSGASCLSGTGCVKPMDWQQQRQMMQDVKQLAEEWGANAEFQLSFGPNAGVYEHVEFGMNTGIKTSVSVAFNSACARQP